MSNKSRRQTVEHLKHCALAAEILQNAFSVLRRLPDGEAKNLLREQLRNYLYNNNYSCVVSPEHPIGPEYKLVIRDDCNGSIYAVDKAYQSFHYRYALANAGQQEAKAADYAAALKHNKAWNEMREFPTYEAIEGVLLSKLEQNQLAPQLVKAMQINDFRDFVHNNCAEEFSVYREQNSMVKSFIAACETEFRTMMNKAGVDERYTDAMVERMKTKGEAWNVTVTDENGKKISGPEFDRHHTIPVHCPNEVASLKAVNDFNHLCLIEKNTHHFLHQLERAMMREDDGLFFEKMMVPNRAACILNFENCIQHDFNEPERRWHSLSPIRDNLIYLNKIDYTTKKVSSLAMEEKSSKKARPYVNNTGRGGR